MLQSMAYLGIYVRKLALDSDVAPLTEGNVMDSDLNSFHVIRFALIVT